MMFIELMQDQLQSSPKNEQRPFTYSYPKTNLCMVDKDGFFSSILTSLTPSRFHQSSSSLSNLTILSYKSDEPVPVSVHPAVLASQSPLLQDLLLSVSAPVLVLPEVEVEIVRNMLDLLCTGRCNLKKNDVLSVVKLLTSLGLHSLVRALEQRGGPVPVREEELLNDRASMEMSLSSGLAKQDAEAENTMQLNKVMKRRPRIKTCNKKVSSSSEEKKPIKNVFPGRYCVMCGKKESNLYKLRVHYTNNHFFSGVSALITDKKGSKCELCGQQFSDCENLFNNIVRHRGATHKDVLKFVQKECENDEGIAYDHCQICDAKKDKWKSDSLGHHLIQEHYKLKLEEMMAPGQVECTICDVKCKTIYDLIAHTGLTHGFAMKMYRDFLASRIVTVNPIKAKRCRKPKQESGVSKVPIKISKRCHLCHVDIVGAGVYWRYPLYAHFSRMHFREELIRDFRTEKKECSVCGIAEDAVGKKLFPAHLGAKHRLVEKYFEKSTIMGFELANDLVLEETIMGDDIHTHMENDSKEMLIVTQAMFQSPSSERKDDSFQEDLLFIQDDMNQPLI